MSLFPIIVTFVHKCNPAHSQMSEGVITVRNIKVVNTIENFGDVAL